VERGAAVIRRAAGLVDMRVEGSIVRAEIAADENQLADIVDRLHDERIRFHSFADQDPTLEDVFMMVTKGVVN